MLTLNTDENEVEIIHIVLSVGSLICLKVAVI